MYLNNIIFPNCLLDAIRADKLVVFAGAGASMDKPTSLLNFFELTKEIAQDTGRIIKDEPCEVFLGALKAREINVHSIAASILTRDCLKHNPLHETIVNLFPSSDKVKIVTTNYDQMFEQVVEEMGVNVPVYNAPALPLGNDINGIIHIHLAVFVVCGIHVQRSTVIRALLPTAFNNNWFASAYMFFYAFFPFLNQCFERIPRGCQKYGCIVFAVSACFVLPFLLDVFKFRFSISYPMMWVVAYCCVSYLKTYHRKMLDSRKFAIVGLLIGISGLIGEIAATYYFGSDIRLFHGDGMRWNKCYNLFEWFFAFGCFNLVRTFRFHSLLINRISSLSLLIYLIHGNFLVRRHVRPYLYNIIHYHLHDRNIPLWLLMFSILILIASALLAYLYQKSIQKIAYQIADNSSNAVAGHMRKHIKIRKGETCP